MTIVYRRGPEDMGATWHEQELAQTNGVRIKHWARPVRAARRGRARSPQVEFEYTALDAGGRLDGTGGGFIAPGRQVFKAIGQSFIADPVVAGAAEPWRSADGRILVDAERARPRCRASVPAATASPGVDLTVAAVEDGKIAAHAIDRYLRGCGGSRA